MTVLGLWKIKANQCLNCRTIKNLRFLIISNELKIILLKWRATQNKYMIAWWKFFIIEDIFLFWKYFSAQCYFRTKSCVFFEISKNFEDWSISHPRVVFSWPHVQNVKYFVVFRKTVPTVLLFQIMMHSIIFVHWNFQNWSISQPRVKFSCIHVQTLNNFVCAQKTPIAVLFFHMSSWKSSFVHSGYQDWIISQSGVTFTCNQVQPLNYFLLAKKLTQQC